MSKVLKNRFSSGARQFHGQDSEKRVVGGLKGRLTPGSGALEGAKSDGITTLGGVEYRIEAKATIHKSMSMKKQWLDKVRREARETGMEPILTVSFVDDNGKAQDINSDFVVMRLNHFKELTGG